MLKTHGVRLVAFAVLAALPNLSAACEGLREGPVSVVVAVNDGDTVSLDNGLKVRLIGMQAPKLALGRPDFPDWPKAGEAKARLEALTLGQPVRLAYGGTERDRYGRALAQMFVVGTPEIWVQQAMLAAGMGRVYAFPDNRKCLVELFGAESTARTNKLGIWSDPYYSVRLAENPQAIADRAGHFELVEGRVLKAEKAGTRIFLNFGRLWKEDFTAVIDGPAVGLFAADKIDPLQLQGVLVRIRGWVDDRDGPRILITHPEQIEVLAAR
ncbi:MAG TPA: thermonuclease family protein [Arsenicitalea sp.]|nr:thermonuclease family protein [Arsenicitalea sp.]